MRQPFFMVCVSFSLNTLRRLIIHSSVRVGRSVGGRQTTVDTRGPTNAEQQQQQAPPYPAAAAAAAAGGGGGAGGGAAGGGAAGAGYAAG
jgi:hypothetical protein